MSIASFLVVAETIAATAILGTAFLAVYRSVRLLDVTLHNVRELNTRVTDIERFLTAKHDFKTRQLPEGLDF